MTLEILCGGIPVGGSNCWAYLPEWFWLLIGPVYEWALVVGLIAAILLTVLPRQEAK